MVDDSALLHMLSRKPYDPQKAHEYYLRTRHLKGRHPGQAVLPQTKTSKGHNSAPAKHSVKQLHAEANNEVAKLTAKLHRLQAVLQELVNRAKTRSGIKNTSPSSKSNANSTSSGGSSKRPSKMTKQQLDKAAQRMRDYRKTHPTKSAPNTEIEALRAQIKEVQAQIKSAIEKARTNATPHQNAGDHKKAPTKTPAKKSTVKAPNDTVPAKKATASAVKHSRPPIKLTPVTKSPLSNRNRPLPKSKTASKGR